MANKSLNEWEQNHINILTSKQMGAWLGRRENRLLDEIRDEIEQAEFTLDRHSNFQDDRTDTEKFADWSEMFKVIMCEIIDEHKAESEDKEEKR